MNIDELTKKDLFLLELNKEISLKKIKVEDTNITVLYEELFIGYSMNDDIESLKRAIFIQWYSVTEPIQYTGIGDLDVEFQKKNLFKVKELIVNKSIDVEFIEMLNHYYNISDWYFDTFLNFESLITINNHCKTNIKVMRNRGLMGTYWNSILNNPDVLDMQ
jgi:hypothetical protein